MELGLTPIVLRYEGRDAEDHMIDLAQLGQSIQGASKILGAGGHLVKTGEYVKRQEAVGVRVLAGQPRAHCFEITAWVATAFPVVAPGLPAIADFAQRKAGNAIEAIFNYTIARLAGKNDAAERAFDVAEKALVENGQTARTAIEAMRDVALGYRPAARQFVSPIGESCEFAIVGTQDNGAFPVTKADRIAIEAVDPIEIGPEAAYEILITEVDLKNKSCKFSMRGTEESRQRYAGEITDPVIMNIKNPYSTALNNQSWVRVRGKPELKAGEIDRLFISNIET